VLRGIFVPRREEMARGLRDEEFHNLYASQDIIRMTKSRRMRWTRLVARMGVMRNAYSVDGKVILV
jgi:hypothetical protein